MLSGFDCSPATFIAIAPHISQVLLRFNKNNMIKMLISIVFRDSTSKSTQEEDLTLTGFYCLKTMQNRETEAIDRIKMSQQKGLQDQAFKTECFEANHKITETWL